MSESLSAEYLLAEEPVTSFGNNEVTHNMIVSNYTTAVAGLNDEDNSIDYGFIRGNCPIDVRTMNLSMFEYGNVTQIWHTIGAAQFIKIFFYVVIVATSIIGNTLVILVVSLIPRMRTTENLYLTNLAVADLLVTLFCTWVHLVKDLTNPHYVLSEVFCKLESFFAISALAASVFTLTAISVGRFAAVMFPYRTVTSKSHVGKIIVLVWVVSLILASPSVVFRDLYTNEFSDAVIWKCDEFWPAYGYYDFTERKCVITFHAKEYFHGAFTLTLYFLPVTIMMFSYGVMIWKLRQGVPGVARQPTRDKRNKKVRKAVTMVLVTFVFCWTPLQSLVIAASFFNIAVEASSSWFSHVEYAAYFIAFSNSALNPIIYCSFSYSFRQGFKTLFRCWMPRKSRLSGKGSHWGRETGRTRETHIAASGDADTFLELNSSPCLRKEPNGRKKLLVVEYRGDDIYSRTMTTMEEKSNYSVLPTSPEMSHSLRTQPEDDDDDKISQFNSSSKENLTRNIDPTTDGDLIEFNSPSRGDTNCCAFKKSAKRNNLEKIDDDDIRFN